MHCHLGELVWRAIVRISGLSCSRKYFIRI
jgi:hypothetical protein